MNKKYLIIGAVIIVAIIAIFAITSSGNIEYTNLNISKTCSLQVPESNNVAGNNESGIITHVDNQHDLNITGYNNAESDNSSSGIDQMNSLVENQKMNAQALEENGTTIYYNKDAGTYAISLINNETQDNVLIVTHDKDLALYIANSVKYDKNGNNIISYGGEDSSNSYSIQDDVQNDDLSEV